MQSTQGMGWTEMHDSEKSLRMRHIGDSWKVLVSFRSLILNYLLTTIGSALCGGPPCVRSID